MRKLGIDFISAFNMPPPMLARLAGRLGCSSISTVLTPLDYDPDGFGKWSMKTDKGLRKELVQALNESGVVLALAEGLLVTPGLDVEVYDEDLDIMAELGAERVNTITFDPDVPRSFDQFAKVAEMAAKRGLPTVSEFAPCFSVKDLKTALQAVKHVGRPDFRVVVDTMHHFRTGGTGADLAALDPNVIGYVQFCDAPKAPSVPDYMEEAMYARLPPGEGAAPLVDMLRAIPPGVTVSIEIPERAKAEAGQGPEARLRHCVAAARRVMQEAEGAIA